MPVDGAIQFQVDRYLVPLSVSRQALQLQDAAGMPLETSLQPNVIYDPIARTITLTRPSTAGDVNANWLLPDQVYKVQFASAGLRALDGAGLRTDQPLVFAIRVGPAITDPTKVRSLQESVGEPDGVSFCDDVLPIFAAKCAYQGGCHSTTDRDPTQAAGLVLDTADGLARTAKSGRPANGSNTGASRGLAPSEPIGFGHDMPIVQPGSPANSWLMYKIELAPPPVVMTIRPSIICGSPPKEQIEPKQTKDFQSLATLPLTPSATTPNAERAVLSDYVLGNEMPYPATPDRADYLHQALSVQERETVRMWIARGASTPACGSCLVGVAPVADAGR